MSGGGRTDERCVADIMQQDAAVGRIDFRAEMLSATRVIDQVM